MRRWCVRSPSFTLVARIVARTPSGCLYNGVTSLHTHASSPQPIRSYRSNQGTECGHFQLHRVTDALTHTHTTKPTDRRANGIRIIIFVYGQIWAYLWMPTDIRLKKLIIEIMRTTRHRQLNDIMRTKRITLRFCCVRYTWFIIIVEIIIGVIHRYINSVDLLKFSCVQCVQGGDKN